ncbi:hypothetical protein UA75_29235 [Actinoalloteichus sp. GBA129-24]|uniref:Uncharacterized protein n=1 Tax=Actinoalloteichus fjordicus TaxID=1612552 RepID=A0AAC9PV31_9PSEU|nr:hypothetical protein UA74_28705 [Actinoalloteichus fjordicus]APU23815.1 hypothetical protein UA75_29235 [Actinoalloteichus sp. GBA129-24]
MKSTTTPNRSFDRPRQALEVLFRPVLLAAEEKVLILMRHSQIAWSQSRFSRTGQVGYTAEMRRGHSRSTQDRHPVGQAAVFPKLRHQSITLRALRSTRASLTRPKIGWAAERVRLRSDDGRRRTGLLIVGQIDH